MISEATYDAWKVSPPCEHEPFECDHRCPYYHCECWEEDDGEEE